MWTARTEIEDRWSFINAYDLGWINYIPVAKNTLPPKLMLLLLGIIVYVFYYFGRKYPEML